MLQYLYMNTESHVFERYVDIQPTPNEVVIGYIANNMSVNERERAVDNASKLFNPAKKIAATVALIPVAAHQEADRIVPAMTEYAKQVTSKPFSVVLFLNNPLEMDNSPEIKKTLDACHEVKKIYPELDFRYFHNYSAGNIGEIRRELWNSVMILAHHDGLFNTSDGDVIGLNHDIDLESLSPKYVARVQDYYLKQQARIDCYGLPQKLNPAFTGITHKLPADHPNIAKAVFWSDFMLMQLRKDSGFEASLAVPFSHYIISDGFRKTSTYESANITRNSPRMSIPNTFGKTSPRRYIERLQNNGLHEIWTNDSFTNNDECRRNTICNEDISEKRLEEIVFESLEFFIERFSLFAADLDFDKFIIRFATGPKNPNSTQGEIFAYINSQYQKMVSRRLRLAKQALKNNLELPLLAEIVETTYNPRDIAKQKELENREAYAFWQSVSK